MRKEEAIKLIDSIKNSHQIEERKPCCIEDVVEKYMTWPITSDSLPLPMMVFYKGIGRFWIREWGKKTLQEIIKESGWKYELENVDGYKSLNGSEIQMSVEVIRCEKVNVLFEFLALAFPKDNN